MTLLELHRAALADLELERAIKPIEDCWARRLDKKIEDMKVAITRLETA